MDEEEQFVNIDLNDDNICSVCKLETDTGTLSFCHVCFELSIEGVSGSALLHSRSLRGHRDCFEKYHLIANQKLSRATASRSAYEGMKRALSQRLSRIVQYAQNREPDSLTGGGARRGNRHQLLCYTQPGEHGPLPQTEAQVPRYAAHWPQDAHAAELEGPGAQELGLGLLRHGWAEGQQCPHQHNHHHHHHQGGDATSNRTRRHVGHDREELVKMSVEELHQLNGQLLLQIQKVFEELTVAVQEKDSLASELHVRHIAIEQLFKNCGKLPWLQVGRAGVRASAAPAE